MNSSRSFLPMCLALGLLPACRSPLEDANRTLSAEIATGDTTLMIGEEAVFVPIAHYGFGAGIPDSAVWSSSDTAVATVVLQGNGRSGFVTARGAGLAWIHAILNRDFHDSARVTVVGPGDVRLRIAVPAGARVHAAVGMSDSLVRIVTGGGTLFTVSRSIPGASAATCNGAFGPSLDLSDGPYTTGDECLIRHSAAGGVRWTLPLGDPDAGLAVAADEGAVVLHSVTGPPGAVVVSRVSSAGVEQWRDTLGAVALAQRSAPAIATNADIYVPWRSTADSSWLTRLTTAGVVRWTVPLPAEPRFTSPAPEATRVIVTYLGGVTAFDTAAGGVAWSRQFQQDNPAATDSTAPSSAVIDRAGRIFVQTAAGLHAYSSAGLSLWVADSLGAGASQASGVGTPTVLTDSSVVVVVAGSRVCGVRPGLGTPRWCGPSLGPGDVVGGVVLGNDLVMYAVRSAGELVALWNRVGADVLGWPTEGGNHQRTRRRQ
jgi:hypothetical protein